MKTMATGAKFDRNRDIKDIAKLVRADIKSLIADNWLPKGFKCSVKIDRSSTYEALSIVITACPGFEIYNITRAIEEAQRPNGPFTVPFLSNQAREVLTVLERTMAAYNRDDSDLASDYHNVHFYQDAKFASELVWASQADLMPLARQIATPVPDNDLDGQDDPDGPSNVFPVSLYQ
jgi:hypothetical protein